MKKGTLFILLGILLILGALGFTGYNLYMDHEGEVASDEAVAALAEEIYDASVSSQDADPETAADDTPALLPWELDPEMDMPTVTVDGYRYIGILDFPTLDLELPVMEEWDYTRLKISPCRFSGSVYLDNMVVCGHNYRSHFSHIRFLGIGDPVIFTDADGNVFRYTVDNVETLNPTEVEEMTTGDWDLTLFTCNLGGRTRCAVRCYRETE